MQLDRARRIPPRSLLSWVWRALLLAAAVGWFAVLRPEALGGPASYIIVSGTSMEPLLHDGDLAVVLRQDAYASGDVVTYRVPEGDVAAGAQVIHRVIGGNAHEGYVLRGDNTGGPDFWRPTERDVLGRLAFFIPDVGMVLAMFRQPFLLGSFLAGTALVYLLLAPPALSTASTAAEPSREGVTAGRWRRVQGGGRRDARPG